MIIIIIKKGLEFDDDDLEIIQNKFSSNYSKDDDLER